MIAALPQYPTDEALNDIEFCLGRIRKAIAENRMNAREGNKNDKRVIKG
jgi:hypothetical protein